MKEHLRAALNEIRTHIADLYQELDDPIHPDRRCAIQCQIEGLESDLDAVLDILERNQ